MNVSLRAAFTWSALLLARGLGFFWLSSFVWRRRLSILCYHAFSLRDGHLFRPGLIMRPELFERRLAWLHRHGFKVVS